MEAHIVVDEALGINLNELAAAWNTSAYGNSPARVMPAPPSTYIPGLVEIVVVTLTTIGGTLVAQGITQIVNSYTEQHPATPPTEVLELTRPDGSPLIVVKRKETQ